MATTKTRFYRFFKGTFFRFQGHRFLGFVVTPFRFVAGLVQLSRWLHKNRSKFQFNDFYNPRPDHPERLKLYKDVLDLEGLDTTAISYLEFGVGRGNSLRWWSTNNTSTDTRFYAFDTFEGLPDDWGAYKAGTFSLGGKFPDIDDQRINFVKGLFQDTLMKQLPEVDFKQRVVLHIDGDMYTSAMYPLAMLHSYLKPGDLIFFDEFAVPLHEFRAFVDFTESFKVKLEPVGAINNYLQAAFRVV